MLTKAEAAGMMRAVQEFFREKIDGAVGTLAARLAALEARNPERGEAGPQGERGADGLAGPQGEIGPAGKDGRDGVDGKDGADGRDGASGPQGEIGPAGKDGRDGVDGKDGADGRDGASGPQGERGADGKDGRDGADGKDGAPGVAGEKGDRGEQGQPGKLPIVRAWADQVYYEGDVVACDGRTYQALRDTGKAPGHDDWICLAERGADGRNGTDGRGVTVRGTFAADLEYRELDVVAMNGASFMARRDNPGDCPGEGWQLVASQGKRGAPGERGPKGDNGERGEPGQPVVAMQCDENGLLTLTNGDGSQVHCDLYNLLSRFKVQ